MTAPTSSELADLVHNYFADRDRPVFYDAAEGTGEYEGVTFSVHNMAANLAKIDRSQWSEYVEWHFGHLAEEGPPELPATYPEVRKRLRVRLASDYWVDNLPYREITRPVADDLHEVLMVVVQQGAASIPPESIQTWGEPMETLWADARKNTLWDEPVERRLALRPTGEKFTLVQGSWWASSRLLDLARYLAPTNSNGAIAMVPVRDLLMFHEIADAGFVHSLTEMTQLGVSWFAEGPDSVSGHLYWWRDGAISRLIALEEEGLKPVWDKDFSRVLADLEASTDPAVFN